MIPCPYWISSLHRVPLHPFFHHTTLFRCIQEVPKSDCQPRYVSISLVGLRGAIRLPFHKNSVKFYIGGFYYCVSSTTYSWKYETTHLVIICIKTELHHDAESLAWFTNVHELQEGCVYWWHCTKLQVQRTVRMSLRLIL